ncbi:ribosomal biogenesis factor-like [Macrosteles quadrilineatus]|uniref:ribosomal biogenesis factor-like n=1 Tax=Macrosteles quadrilineatus TaxID=74068 RepID=UPI0023E1BC48|nr:ribosomal biogenesis factor-like [Macrosteles quadrilineatus]XP_054285497.1 ribosomal biogenesis factor-like [Macrosteles quadrilineatus]
MGKGGKQKGGKNVFKVAGARSLKAKNKAKAVSTQLKKLTEVTKQKTVEMDQLLNELQETVRQAQPQKQENKPSLPPKEDLKSRIEKFNKTEESSAEALDKLGKMEV